ncbi:MAG TPA: D-arabinono-1,4-lactone oxidase [Myxococcota bacterium]|nr:D-arabinono-1,4-lactone oxidase [Myxococcota bacterium]
MSPRWRNWGRTVVAHPREQLLPGSEEELCDIVRSAARAGERVKAIGAGHSFSAIAATDGRLLRLDRYTRVLRVDRERLTAEVQAGIPLSRLSEELLVHGLALPNLGDIASQSIAGAISTATHGTGRGLGNLATFVRGLSLVGAEGEILRCSAEERPELFRVARVGLGALGIVSTVTLQCVPAFPLHALEMPLRLDAVLEALDEHVDGNDHFEFFWVPHTGWALTKRNNRTERGIAPRGAWAEFRDDVLLSNLGFGLLCRLGRLRPAWIPRLARALPSAGRVEYVDHSHRVFASPRLVRFSEMEYAIPRAAARQAISRLVEMVKARGFLLSFPVEVRFVAGDDIPLSPAFGRETCYIAVHVFQGMAYEPYFRAVEEIMRSYGGRPHWGKIHFQGEDTLRELYPEWERFQAVRGALDPAQRFSNPYLIHVLGRPAERADPFRSSSPARATSGPAA